MAFIVPKKGRTISRNAHLPDRVSRTVDAVVPIIQQQNHHAIQAKGFPIYVYKRLTAGKPCKCSFHRKTNPLQADLYDDDGVASQEQLQAIMDASRFSLEDYNPDETLQRTTRSVNAEVESEFGMEEDESDIPTSLQEDAYSAGACPLCFGTGVVGGYSCLEATRIVLFADDISESNAAILSDGYPQEISLDLQESFVTFSVVLPMQIPNSTVKLRVFNGFELQHGSVLIEDNGVWKPFNGSVKVGRNKFKIQKVNFRRNEVEPFNFTHMEIMLPLVSKADMADIPNLVNSFDPLRVYPYASATFSLSPEIPRLNPQDVIADVYHKLLWMVTSSTPVYASNGQIWHQTVECRVIEPYEATHSLLIPDAWLPKQPVTQGGVGNVTRKGGY